MLVRLQFESIGRRKRQGGRPGTRQVQCTSASHSLPDDVAAAHSDYECATARTVAELEDGVHPWFQPYLPAPSQGSSLLRSVRTFCRIT
jgi:antirestriction protein ArdC